MYRSMSCLGSLARISLVVVGAATTAASQAAMITTNYGSFVGTTRTYQTVMEVSDDANPFGSPMLLGDTLVFMPTMFDAVADSAGGDSEIVDSQIRFTLAANAGEVLDQMMLFESGTVSLTGPTSEFAFASVATPIFYHIRAIDGVMIDGPNGSMMMTFTPQGAFDLMTDGAQNGTAWAGSALLNFQDIIDQDPNFSGSATLVEITFDNTLTVFNSPGTTASITKTHARITVPEVSTMVLAACGLGAMTTVQWRRMRRRKTNVSV